MKKTTFLLLAISYIFIFSFEVRAAKITTSTGFKYQMHQIFDSYNHARISISLEKLDIADLHLEDMLEAINNAKEFAPKKEHGRILDTFGKLQEVIAELRAAMKRGDRLTTKIYSMEMLNGCVTCHTKSKLDYLFKFPRRTSIFGEYMHKVSEHLDLARITMEYEGDDKSVRKHIKLMIYYLDLLKAVFPEEGPSGIILDQKDFSERIGEVRKGLDRYAKGKKLPDLESARTSLNGLCVVCHEPERIK
jgi:cytochrome c553